MGNRNDSFEHFSTLTHEEIYNELTRIKYDLCWLDEDICLTKSQRELFVDIKNRVKTMLGNDR